MALNREAAFFSFFACCCLLLKTAASAEPCEVNIVGPNPQFVEFGAPAVLNCTSTCGSENNGWETSLRKQKEDNGSSWISVNITMTQWNTSVQCFFIGSSTITNRTILTAYKPPRNVIIDLPPVMEVGQSYDLRCGVLNIAPKRYLTVLIQRGDETLHTETYANDLTDHSTDVNVTYTITAERTDNGAQYTCLAQLDLGPNGGFFKNSTSKSVQTYALPGPKLVIPMLMEEGTEVTAKCEVVDPFPIGDVNITMRFGEQVLSVNETRTSGMLIAEAVVPVAGPGVHSLNCTASMAFGGISTTAGHVIHVYRFPGSVLDIEDPLSAGTDVDITCIMPRTVPSGVLVTIRSDTVLKVCEDSSHSLCTYTLRIQKHHNGMNISCEANLKELNITKTTWQKLNVTYGPEFSDALCPSTQTLIEGAQNKIRCEADGYPHPTIECTKDGSTVTWQNIGRNHSGSYICNATNSNSAISQEVTITVEYKPTVTLTIEAPKNLKKGNNVTLICQADGLPSPEFSWTTPDGTNLIYSQGNSTITILRAEHHNSGTYKCEAKNRHGQDSKHNEINVTDDLPVILALTLASVAATVGAASAVGYYFYNRARKIRIYRLQNPKQPTKMESLIPSESKVSSI